MSYELPVDGTAPDQTVTREAHEQAINDAIAAAVGAVDQKADDHIADTSNPHSVTAAQVGLGDVDNTSDADKPISTATQAALDDKVESAEVIIGWAASQSYASTSITRNDDGVVTAATVVWPDGSAGALSTTLNATIPAIDAYEITHVDSGVKAIQPTLTRNAQGAVTAQPALTTEAI